MEKWMKTYSLLIWMTACLLLACSGGDGDSDVTSPTPSEREHPVLDVYVYAPGQAVPTRANEGLVNPDQEERTIHRLQMWVFTNSDHQKVAYYESEIAPSFSGSDVADTHKFQLPLPDDFNQYKNVDVFVLANVTDAAIDGNTAYDILKDKLLTGKYGLGESERVMSVPMEGLPMSGYMYNQPIYGKSPVYRVGTESSMATVKLVRMVSKIRFLFCCTTSLAAMKITGVTLDAGTIPDVEYMFLNEPYTYNGNLSRVGSDFNTTATPSLFTIDQTARYVRPAYYTFERFKTDNPEATPQQYEDLVNDGLKTHTGESEPRLTERRLYLRESNQKLSGTIKYQVKETAGGEFGKEKSATFTMSAAGEFSRNHTWIVYGYLAYAEMNVVTSSITDWIANNDDHTLYNW